MSETEGRICSVTARSVWAGKAPRLWEKEPRVAYQLRFCFLAPPQVFAGAELVTFLVARNLAPDRATATDVGKHLLNSGRIVHVDDENYFRDERLFYRFTEDVGGAEGGSTDQESDQVADESRI